MRRWGQSAPSGWLAQALEPRLTFDGAAAATVTKAAAPELSLPIHNQVEHAASAEAKTAAHTITVTSFADSGAGSLRDAISQANATGGDWTISLKGGGPQQVYTVASQIDITDTSGTITLQQADLNFVAIDGGSATRIFHVANGAHLVLNNTNLQNGLATDNGSGSGPAEGGDILIDAGGTVDLVSESVHSGTAKGGAGANAYGGAIYNAGTLNIDNNSDFLGNKAIGGDASGNGNGGNAEGGAIYSAAASTLHNSSTQFSSDTVTAGAGAGTGHAGTATNSDVADHHADSTGTPGPTDLQLSNSSFSLGNQLVGSFSGTDADSSSFTYALVSGTGSTDNSAFTISSDKLQFTGTFDANHGSYSIRARVTDGLGHSLEKTFTIAIAEPTLTATTFFAGTPVGTLGAIGLAQGSTPFFSLVPGDGATDNALFAVNGTTLSFVGPAPTGRTAFSVRLEVNDGHGHAYDRVFSLAIKGPADFQLSNTSVSLGSLRVGSFSGTDADSSTLTYSLVSGTGSTDNALFRISGTELDFTGTLDTSHTSYSIRARVTDGLGQALDKVFTITSIGSTLTGTTFYTDSPVVGTLAAAGLAAGATPVFSLVPGDGATDNAQFAINGTTLSFVGPYDPAHATSYSVRIEVNDGHGNAYDKVFAISALGPTSIALSSTAVTFADTGSTTVGTLSAIDASAGTQNLTFSLVAGTGSHDNDSFAIAGTTLSFLGRQNHSQTDFSIRVRVGDGQHSYDQVFALSGAGPTSLSLSSTRFTPIATGPATVGTLSATEADGAQSLTFTLVPGDGGTDNASFAISGTTLTYAGPAATTQKDFSIRVEVTDAQGHSLDKVFSIGRNDPGSPADIKISATTVNDQVVNSTVGTLSTVDGNTGASFTYSLVNGSGSDDNPNFAITNNTLTYLGPIRAHGTTYSIRIQVNDGLGHTLAKTLTLTASDAAPTGISLSKNTFDNIAGTVVGTLSATDDNAGAALSYALVNDKTNPQNSADNGLFAITGGNALTFVAAPDSTHNAIYFVTLQVTDVRGHSYTGAFLLKGNSPFVALDNNFFAAGGASNIVGHLSTVNAPGTYQFTLVGGTGATNNNLFSVGGDGTLHFTGTFEASQAATGYSIRVQADNGHGSVFATTLQVVVANSQLNVAFNHLNNSGAYNEFFFNVTDGTVPTDKLKFTVGFVADYGNTAAPVDLRTEPHFSSPGVVSFTLKIDDFLDTHGNRIVASQFTGVLTFTVTDGFNTVVTNIRVGASPVPYLDQGVVATINPSSTPSSTASTVTNTATATTATPSGVTEVHTIRIDTSAIANVLAGGAGERMNAQGNVAKLDWEDALAAGTMLGSAAWARLQRARRARKVARETSGQTAS
ncbi:MAG: hypothetical protein EPO08_17305 [Rhodospirillaceae bacterium]|nr:MAG: hypothetical protein EPO08_17305 [Rhodospirillaceae bacterium]